MEFEGQQLWPPHENGRVVFLLDCLTYIERRILKEEIARQRPTGADYTVISLGLRKHRPQDPGLVALRQLVGDVERQGLVSTYFQPVRVSWLTKPIRDGRSVSLKDLVIGETSDPGFVKQHLIYKRSPKPYRLVAAEGADISDLKKSLLDRSPQAKPQGEVLVQHIFRSAFLSLERSERPVKGSRYKIPRMVAEEVLGKPEVVERLNEISLETGKNRDAVEKEARECLKEMSAQHTPAAMDTIAALGRFMYTRGFDEGIEFKDGDLERIRELLAEHPVAFLMTHKSHIDGVLLMTVFHDYNLTPVHIFGGINMNFFGLGSLLKRSGTVFLRRSFQDDPVYKQLFKSYIDYLGEKRFPLLWALEGTRSRTGKLMPPRYGLLNYVINAHLRAQSADLMLIPISIVYDQVPEVGDYDRLQLGGKKRPESASWFMQYISGLKNPNGKIHVRFGEGVKVSDHLPIGQADAVLENRDLQKIAFQLSVDANNSTPITVTSLITFVMLTHGHQALTFGEIFEELRPLVGFLRGLDVPMTLDVDKASTNTLRTSLEKLTVTGIVNTCSEGTEPVYSIELDSGRSAAYYRNGMIHFLVTSAIADLALLAVTEDANGKAVDQVHEDALYIRDLLKYEFFFEDSKAFIVKMEQELKLRVPRWKSVIRRGPAAIRSMFRNDIACLLGHGTLRPFLESYLLLAEALTMMSTDEPVDKKALVNKALGLGKQRLMQKRLFCEESISSSHFDNAIKIAESRGLLLQGENVEMGRQQLVSELSELTARTRFLNSVSEARSYVRGARYIPMPDAEAEAADDQEGRETDTLKSVSDGDTVPAS